METSVETTAKTLANLFQYKGLLMPEKRGYRLRLRF